VTPIFFSSPHHSLYLWRFRTDVRILCVVWSVSEKITVGNAGLAAMIPEGALFCSPALVLGECRCRQDDETDSQTVVQP
jgi:hypothetical protein